MFGSITNWEGDLLDQFNRLQRDMESLWGAPAGPASIRAVARGSYPAINVGTTPEGAEVYIFAAGLDQDTIDLSIQQNVLTVSGNCPDQRPEGSNAYLQERFRGDFRRVIALPEDVNPDSARASYRNGLLHISLKRREEARPRQIQVNPGESVSGGVE